MSRSHVAFVTGAGRGIGAAIAAELAGSGAAVVLGARTLSECERTALELRARGGSAFAVELDVGESASIAAAIARARELAGPIDWLVNNAGIAVSAPLLPREGSTDELYERHMRVNFHGARRMAEGLLPAMKSAGYGRIVNVASSAALRAYRYVAAYCASKHALLGWARAAALDLESSGVQVATVCPHYVDSPMTDASVRTIAAKTGRSEAEARALLAAENPAGRLVLPSQIAFVVRGLLEGDANGALVELDGSVPRYHPAAR
ncbi:MAG: SDR family oxidoreductase [Planctomycetes bacterium]|nr:SDR family oxidoreductase [Planctomycetota bacterium]